jgi:DNA-directed RNA polymerase II subunit RPB2
MRMDKTAVVLHYGQIPLVKQRYGEYISHEENPYGFNAIVAIACYTGYNVEDAILINAGALARGMFRTTYYTTYSAHEERGDPATSGSEIPVDHRFTNIESVADNMVGLRPGYDYSQLDRHGLIREGTPVTDKTILIGLTATGGTVATRDQRTDGSTKPKRGQLGYVDKTYMTEGDAGDRVAKVRVREERIPTLGDKFAGRAGQKGTIGMVIPERDMPFTKDGIRPDLIINPHAIPSRMTIAQLMETLLSKIGCQAGALGDGTPFNATTVEDMGRILRDEYGMEPHGNEIMYNGQTGRMMETSIFIGPCYYQRLRHCSKDKLHSRASGPLVMLTRQPAEGRAREGGLRFGEMERDCVIGHGMAEFTKERLMECSDAFLCYSCKSCGLIAVANDKEGIWACKGCGNTTNFSAIEIPYAYKLLLQELETMSITSRIITQGKLLKHLGPVPTKTK